MFYFPSTHETAWDFSIKFNYTAAMTAGFIFRGGCSKHFYHPLPHSIKQMHLFKLQTRPSVY